MFWMVPALDAWIRDQAGCPDHHGSEVITVCHWMQLHDLLGLTLWDFLSTLVWTLEVMSSEAQVTFWIPLMVEGWGLR